MPWRRLVAELRSAVKAAQAELPFRRMHSAIAIMANALLQRSPIGTRSDPLLGTTKNL
jgi:hypothetical protein